MGKWRVQERNEITDEVLEQKLIDKFKEKGWD